MQSGDVRKEQVAEAFGVHHKTVIAWVKAGCPAKRASRHKPWTFDLTAVDAWIRRKGRQTTPGRPPTRDGSELARAKLQLTLERALWARLKRQELEGVLHNAEDCQARQLRQIIAVRSAFADLPRSLAPRLAGRKEEQIADILAKRIRDIIDQLGKGREHGQTQDRG